MKKIINIFVVAIVVMMVACGKKTQAVYEETDAVVAESVTRGDTLLNTDSLRHTAEYIAQRIDTIYKYKSNRRFCSRRYLELDAEASKLSEEMGYIYIDSDHWIVGQDTDPNWRYYLKSILSMNDSIASVEMMVHNFNDHKVILNLLYERGDWYVDDFHTFYEEDGEMQVLSEQEEIRRFIRECNYEKYQTKIETVYSRDFHIDKHIDTINKQVAEALQGKVEFLPFNEYALTDIDQNGEAEVTVRNKESNLTAVFTTVGKTELLAIVDKSGDVAFYDVASELFRKNFEDYVSFPSMKWHAFESKAKVLADHAE